MVDPELQRRGEVRWELPQDGDMRVPGIVFASESLLPDEPDTLRQVANVATLPGIVQGSYAMPDLHLGYGFCIGAVAATEVDDGGVVSPGGVGFDISCGVRVLVAPLSLEQVEEPAFDTLMDRLGQAIPRGTGPGGIWEVDDDQVRRLLVEGSAYAVEAGYGTEEDLERTEDRGRLADADPDAVSDKALRRGLKQVGSLGGGNHFLEVQVVDRVVDDAAADAFGVQQAQLVVTIHCGSRGLGHQVCTDHVRAMQAAMQRYSITVPDKQLACAPVRSPEGQDYLGAMAAAANYGRANRQVLAEATRDAFDAVFGSRALRLLYDVSHNMAKLEDHDVEGRQRTLCVHRKGATLALPPGHPDLPEAFRDSGQPVVVPGSMGTASWLLAGAGGEAFASTCHGAGRAKSRSGAKKEVWGETLREELEAQGIVVRALSDPGLAEEAPVAYKDVDEVVRVCERAGVSRRVARLRPLGVVKG
ncbi:MAG TPA: RtcB family protein [Egibacteraceae bacterium]|nr:RtcB family protein [Actinomycetota bacterium]HWB72189.1 RtcB family protein [Egibacteraceae bacterium]